MLKNYPVVSGTQALWNKDQVCLETCVSGLIKSFIFLFFKSYLIKAWESVFKFPFGDPSSVGIQNGVAPLPTLAPPSNLPHFTCSPPLPLQSLGINLSSGMGIKRWNLISQEEIKWYAGMYLLFGSDLFIWRAPEQWLFPGRDVPSLAEWSARGVVLKGPKL